MGLFNRKKEKVEKLLTYGQRGLDNGDIFPSTYFLEEMFMTERELEARFPKRFSCRTGYGYCIYDAKFIRIGSSSYNVTLYKYGELYKRLFIKYLIPMTPIGTTLYDGGEYVLLSKERYDRGHKEYNKDGSVLYTYDKIFAIDKSTFEMRLKGHGVEYILNDMNYWDIY